MLGSLIDMKIPNSHTLGPDTRLKILNLLTENHADIVKLLTIEFECDAEDWNTDTRNILDY